MLKNINFIIKKQKKLFFLIKFLFFKNKKDPAFDLFKVNYGLYDWLKNEGEDRFLMK